MITALIFGTVTLSVLTAGAFAPAGAAGLYLIGLTTLGGGSAIGGGLLLTFGSAVCAGLLGCLPKRQPCCPGFTLCGGTTGRLKRQFPQSDDAALSGLEKNLGENSSEKENEKNTPGTPPEIAAPLPDGPPKHTPS